MSRVTYQAMLDEPGDGDRYTPLDSTLLRSKRRDALIARRDALIAAKTQISPRQRRWLDETATVSGLPVDVVVMTALDLLIALDLDWESIGRAGELRAAVAEAVGVRTRGGTTR